MRRKTRVVGRHRGARGSVWRIGRADLAAGGGEIVRLVHPLLPEFRSGWIRDGGLQLFPEVARPAALTPFPAEEAAAFLARFLSLAAFLRSQGLGIAAADLLEVGARADDPRKPWLGAVPVPEWRAISPALATAAIAARLFDVRLDANDDVALRRTIERALPALPRGARRLVTSALAADLSGGRPETLLREIVRTGLADRVGPDLLGLVLPSSFRYESGPAPFVSSGAGALFAARGRARRERCFTEVAAASPLEEGATLRRIAEALEPDERAMVVSAWASGKGTAAVRGPAIALVLQKTDELDPRTRAVLPRLPELGIEIVEVRERPVPPWESARLLVADLSLAEISSVVWLPFATPFEAAAAWEELARVSRGDLGRFLFAAEEMARSFDLLEPAGRRTVRAAGTRRRDSALEVAAILLAGFDEKEVAAASGLSPDAVETSLRAARISGRLKEDAGGRLLFAEEEDRARTAGRLSAGARRDAVERLERAGVPADRFVGAALARGLERDHAAARQRFARALGEGDRALSLELLLRAPAEDPVLGDPLAAVLVLHDAALFPLVRRAAKAIREDAVRLEPLAKRLEAARKLVRVGERDVALVLVPEGDEPHQLLARARILLDLHRDKEASALAGRLPKGWAASSKAADRCDALLLRAVLAAHERDHPAAKAALAELADVLKESTESTDLQVAFEAGSLASDMGRTGEAAGFFRFIKERAPNASVRADACFDLAAVLIPDGRFAEAQAELQEALPLYSQVGLAEGYLAVLANRVELALLMSDFSAAERDLEKVLTFDRAPGREHQLLFGIPALQRIRLANGDLAGAEAAFHEAAALGNLEGHIARREILALEASRLIAARRPDEAVRRLDEAAKLPGTRSLEDSLLARLRVSAAIDLGQLAEIGSVDAGEQRLLLAEKRLSKGEAVSREAKDVLAKRLDAPGGAGSVAARVVEWTARFPDVLGSRAGEEIVAIGRRAASIAGLDGARDLLQALGAERATAVESPPLPEVESKTVAEDDSTRVALADVRRLAKTPISILVLGESGTGKEIVAREIHRLSGRAGRFVAVNVAAISDTLVESELFGHVRGAFTGAERDRAGLVEESSGGTLFLDEIGDLPLPTQAKLLRVLQEREVRRVGDVKTRRVDLRVVAATHRDLASMIEAKTFRGDLYHRLNGHSLSLAPLRERPRDLSRLLARSLDGFTLEPEARRLLLAHRWPGNVRELLSTVESAKALAAPSTRVGVEHLPRAVRQTARSVPAGPGRYRDAVDEARRQIIREALEACDGNRTRAARFLGLARQSLLYEMKKLKIE